jgi:hypothetical protein
MPDEEGRTSGYAPPGTPDLYVVGRDRQFWIEVKTKKGKLSEEQKAMMNTLVGLGQKVMVARDVEDVQFVNNN